MNPLLIRRRGMMTARGGVVIPDYEQNGLVLWLDGILQGSTANAWTDLVSGHVFNAVNNVAFNSDNVQFGFDGNSYLIDTAGTYTSNPSAGVGTIEFVAEKTSGYFIVFAPDSMNRSICVYQNNNGILYRMGSGQTKPYVIATLTKGSFSISDTIKKENGADMSVVTPGAYAPISFGHATVGCLRNNYFHGKIYSVRVYNRQLTEAEIMHNLAIDNERFQLGLNL